MNRAEHCRRKLGLSYAEMAQICGVHRQTWIKWERGERQPDAAALRLMAILEILQDKNILEDILLPLAVELNDA